MAIQVHVVMLIMHNIPQAVGHCTYSALQVLAKCCNYIGASGIIAVIGALRYIKDLCKLTVDLSDLSKKRVVCEYDYKISFANHNFCIISIYKDNNLHISLYHTESKTYHVSLEKCVHIN